MSNWYNIQNNARETEIEVFGEIGAYGVNAVDFIRKVKDVSTNSIKLTINSGGGSVIDAFAIYDYLKKSKKNVKVDIIGLCGSAATVIALAGNKKPNMAENALFMIHNPSLGVINISQLEAEEMRELANELLKDADLLDKIAEKIANIYADATGKSKEYMRELMDAETWMNSEEAEELGFVNVTKAVKVAANVDKSILNKIGATKTPEKLVNNQKLNTMSEFNEKTFYNKVEDAVASIFKRKEDEAKKENEAKEIASKIAGLEADLKAKNEELENANKEIESLRADLESVKLTPKADGKKKEVQASVDAENPDVKTESGISNFFKARVTSMPRIKK